MKPEELARMRNPLNRRNVNRIRNLLNKIDFCIATRSRNAIETDNWFREIADELGACRAIAEEGVNNGK